MQCTGSDSIVNSNIEAALFSEDFMEQTLSFLASSGLEASTALTLQWALGEGMVPE